MLFHMGHNVARQRRDKPVAADRNEVVHGQVDTNEWGFKAMVDQLRAMGCVTVMDVFRESAKRGLSPATFLAEVEIRLIQTVREG